MSKWVKSSIGFGLAVVVTIVAGCAIKETVKPLAAAQTNGTASDSKPPTYKPLSGQSADGDLNSINEKVQGHWRQLEQKYDIAVLGSGMGKDEISMMIRSHGDVERKISEAEVTAIKRTIFDFIGQEFKLNVSVQDCCGGRGFTGIIKEVDADGHRVLIVNENEKNGNTDDPAATWAGFTDDGIIVSAGRKDKMTFDHLTVGQEVQAWSTGLMLDSYPGQTSLVKLQILQKAAK